MGPALIVGQPPAQEVPQPGRPAVQIVRNFFALAPHVENSVTLVKPKPSAARPAQVLLGTLNDYGFRVTQAIPVNLETREDSIVASWLEIEEFGTGSSMSSAFLDLGHTLAELYRSLEADQAKLGPDLSRVWNVLKEYLVRR